MNQVFRIILKTPLSISAAVCRNQVSVFWQILQESEKLNVKTFAVTYFSLKIARLPYVEIKYISHIFQKCLYTSFDSVFQNASFCTKYLFIIMYLHFSKYSTLKNQVSLLNGLRKTQVCAPILS